MFVITHKRRLKRGRSVVGGGLIDWLGRAVETVGRVLSTNKDTIINTANVIGNVAKAGATTASAVKQIIDVVKAKRAAQLPKPLEKVMSQKSLDFLQQLARSERGVPENNINARIAGAGFKTIKK